MPNWVTNDLEIVAQDAKDLQKFINDCGICVPQEPTAPHAVAIDFEKIMPTPKDLISDYIGVTDGVQFLALLSLEIEDKQNRTFAEVVALALKQKLHLDVVEIKLALLMLEKYLASYGKLPFEQALSLMLEDMLFDDAIFERVKILIKKYSYGIINEYQWQKHNWGCCQPTIDFLSVDDFGSTMKISFDSAWYPPLGILRHIAKLYGFSIYGTAIEGDWVCDIDIQKDVCNTKFLEDEEEKIALLEERGYDTEFI